MVHILGFRERERVAGGDDGLVLASRLMGDRSYMIFDPAWKTVVWRASELDVGGVWTGTPVLDSFLELRDASSGRAATYPPKSRC
jgi:hypothetical protein